MNVRKLEIDRFKNLRGFSIKFDPSSFTTVIVGANGSGKSNVLEALILIFRDLDLGHPPKFGYKLEYTCREHLVTVEADPSQRTPARQISIQVDGESVSLTQFLRDGREKYLPKYIFGYYSGPSNRMEKHFEDHHQRFYRALLRGDEQPLRPLLYARHVYGQFVLLGFFNDEDQVVLRFLSSQLRIEEFDSVTFVLHTPNWYNKARRNTDGDPRFWYARGTVKPFLSTLYELALAPMRYQVDSKTEHLYLFIPEVHTLQKLAAKYASPQEFFKALESTYISDLITEVRIRVRVRNADESLTFREMSEGEQQILMVLGLLRFTKEDESLFLLDEPDTHLNPAWSQEYLSLLRQVAGSDPSSQIIMTTHDPLVIAGLESKDVRILEIDQHSDRIHVILPEESPMRMGYSEILTSDIFKLRAAINPQIQRLLSEKRQLAIKEDLTTAERIKLDELNSELAEFDYTSVVRDPLYEPFVEAMTRYEQAHDLGASTLTREERERRRSLAEKILAELKDG